MYITSARTINQNIPNKQISVDNYLAYLFDAIPLPEITKSVECTVHSEKFFRTITRIVPEDYAISPALRYVVKDQSIKILVIIQQFIHAHADLTATLEGITGMENHYNYFKIPKRSGGLREICAPNEDLMGAMRKLKECLEKMALLPHDCAYAYVKGRSCKDALIEHQYNESKWFLKLDLKNFFTNCTKEFIIQQLQQLWQFKYFDQDTLELLISFCSLNNGLPQGTPLSPIITNLIMVPIDHAINKALHNEGNYVYTRYADDLLISSKYQFNPAIITQSINNAFTYFHAPFTINADKTRFGSAAGSNWNLGLMLNKDNNITVGHKNIQRLKAMINNFLRDFTNQNYWSIIDTQEMIGQISYARNISKGYIDFIIQRLEQKYDACLVTAYKQILNS